jgi:hypothetical protein
MSNNINRLVIGCLVGGVIFEVIFMSLSERAQKAKDRKRPDQDQSSTKTKKKGARKPTGSTSSEENHNQQSELIAHRWQCVGASVKGTMHALSKSPCQDYNCYESLPNGELIVAVADGAGSASQAKIGAELACKAAVEYLKRALRNDGVKTDDAWRRTISATFDTALTRLFREAQTKQIALSEFATTLIVMVFTQDLIVGGMVGDGTGVVMDAEGNLSCIFVPQKGEYVNQAYFLTTPHALSNVEFQCIHSQIHAVALLTDGLIPLSCSTLNNLPYTGFFVPIFKFCGHVQDHTTARQELTNWLNSAPINQRTTDDKTLVLITKKQLSEGRSVSNEGVRSERENVQARPTGRQRRGRKATKSQQ